MTKTDDPTGQKLMPTKRHFAALDGLRGVAALMVVIFHFMEIVIGDYSKLFIGHDWLAVDFFYCLAGLVIGSMMIALERWASGHSSRLV